MSCEPSTQAFERCREVFWELMEDYSFQANIYMNFLDDQDQWKEKEISFNEDPYDNFFDYLWKWDCERVNADVKEAALAYLDNYSSEEFVRWRKVDV